jgi:hypothetical protein
MVTDSIDCRMPGKAASNDFRASRGTVERMVDIDGSGVFWQRGVA